MSASHAHPLVHPFLDQGTETWSYVVYDHAGGSAAVIDPVLDFDAPSGRTSTSGAERIIEFLRAKNLSVEWVLETHAHATTCPRRLHPRAGGRQDRHR